MLSLLIDTCWKCAKDFDFDFVLFFLKDEKGLSVGMFDVLQNTSSFPLHFHSFSCCFVCI